MQHFRKLVSKELEDFFDLKNKLQKENIQTEIAYKKLGVEVLKYIETSGVSETDFAYAGEFLKHFQKLTKLRFLKDEDLKFEGRLNTVIEDSKNLYAGKLPWKKNR